MMKLIAKATICCWPPERFTAGSSSRSPKMGNISITSARAFATPSRSRRFVQPARSKFSRTVKEPKTPCPPGICTIPMAAISCGGACVMSRPSKMMAPLSASTVPLMDFNKVLLPAPLVPNRATISPSSISILMPCRTMRPSYPE